MKIRVVSTITGKKIRPLNEGDKWVVTQKGTLMVSTPVYHLSETDSLLIDHDIPEGTYSVQFAFYRDPVTKKWRFSNEILY